jgi:hypothetical protein
LELGEVFAYGGTSTFNIGGEELRLRVTTRRVGGGK